MTEASLALCVSVWRSFADQFAVTVPWFRFFVDGSGRESLRLSAKLVFFQCPSSVISNCSHPGIMKRQCLPWLKSNFWHQLRSCRRKLKLPPKLSRRRRPCLGHGGCLVSSKESIFGGGFWPLKVGPYFRPILGVSPRDLLCAAIARQFTATVQVWPLCGCLQLVYCFLAQTLVVGVRNSSFW